MIYSAVALGRSAAPRLTRSWAVAILFGMAGLALVVGPSVVDGQIPGDLGDAQFNSYVLEHFFCWISGRDASFWNADFFYPFPLTIAFSDNFLGNAFVYALFRAVGFAREDAFRLWYVAGFVVNFATADYALVRFRYSRFAAALGAFSLPSACRLRHRRSTLSSFTASGFHSRFLPWRNSGRDGNCDSSSSQHSGPPGSSTARSIRVTS